MPYFLLTLSVLAFDQFIKAIVTGKLEPLQSVTVIKDVFTITYVRNYGAAFGILQSQTLLLIALSIAVILFVWINRNKLSGYPKVFQVGLGLALGGALGNLVDRIRLGYVVDFLDFQFWPVFNLADIAIVSGVGLIILGFYQDHKAQTGKNMSGAPAEVSRGTVGKEEI
ncbi:MAG: signal peptidase II [Bacteroidota bacterium]